MGPFGLHNNKHHINSEFHVQWSFLGIINRIVQWASLCLIKIYFLYSENIMCSGLLLYLQNWLPCAQAGASLCGGLFRPTLLTYTLHFTLYSFGFTSYALKLMLYNLHFTNFQVFQFSSFKFLFSKVSCFQVVKFSGFQILRF